MHKRIRTLIADQDCEFSKNLSIFLNQQRDIQVVAIVRDGHGAVISCKETLPDLVVMDLRLPVVDSVRAIQSIVAQNEFAKILAVSSNPDDRYAIEAVKAGACGFIVKNGSGTFNEIAIAVRQIAIGEVVINSTLASHILREFS